MVIKSYKRVGETPLDVIKIFKKKNPEYKNLPMTYAGRLDPLAEGELLILAGDDVYHKDKYLNLDKEYEAEIVLGAVTDSNDILGLLLDFKKSKKISQKELDKFKGEFEFEFELPVYSSYKIKGKPLFWWARQGKLDEIKIPKRKTQIYDIELIENKKILAKDLLKELISKIELVRGDFRQDEIKESWKNFLNKDLPEFDVVKIRIYCSAGTYIRALAQQLHGSILSLKRTKIYSKSSVLKTNKN